MAQSKMLILRGNSAGPGSYPDESGNPNVAWPIGALHVNAARDFARRLGYEPVVLDKPGQPQSQHSPQATAAIKAFLDDESVSAFYGFSGGGYNLRHVLDYLAAHKPTTIHRIDRLVVIGAPFPQGKAVFNPANFNAVAMRRAKHLEPADWDVIYRTNPHPNQLPSGLPAHTSPHMFGPDVLLAGWPETA